MSTGVGVGAGRGLNARRVTLLVLLVVWTLCAGATAIRLLVGAGQDEQNVIRVAQLPGGLGVPNVEQDGLFGWSGPRAGPSWSELVPVVLVLGLLVIVFLWGIVFGEHRHGTTESVGVFMLFAAACGATLLANAPRRLIWWAPAPGNFSSMTVLWAFVAREERAIGVFLLAATAAGLCLLMIAAKRNIGQRAEAPTPPQNAPAR